MYSFGQENSVHFMPHVMLLSKEIGFLNIEKCVSFVSYLDHGFTTNECFL